jgi:hypothetical protein
MNTTAAALEAQVTVATIRAWCRQGVIAAVKTAGRWIIDTASLAARIVIGKMKAAHATPARNRDLDITIGQEVAQASYIGSAAGLRAALTRVEARNIGAFIDPAGVRISSAQWNDLAAWLRNEIANLTGERRTSRAVYDYQ